MDFHRLICALILWRSRVGLLIGKFHQFLKDLSVPNMIMVGIIISYFYFFKKIRFGISCEPSTKHTSHKMLILIFL